MKFKFLNPFLLIIALSLTGFSQTVEIYQNDDYSVCPNTEIQYSAVHSSTTVNCGHNWEITNGTIISYESQDSLWVYVKWNDSNTDGMLKVVLYDCDDNAFDVPNR